MKKIILITLLLINAIFLIADQSDDLQFAVGLYRDNNYNLAEVELKKFLNNYPDSKVDADVKFLLGNIYLTKREYKRAEIYFRELYNSTTHPQIREEVALGLGQCKYSLNKLTKARSIFQNFVAEYSNSQFLWKAYYYLGKIDFSEKRFDYSLTNLEKARSLNDKVTILSAILELKIAQNMPNQIDELANEIVKKADSENKFRALLIYHNYNLSKNRTDKIFSIGFDRIPSTSQYFFKYNLILGTAYYHEGKFEKALERLNRVESEKAKYYSALCYYELQNENKAKTILNQLINSDDIQISSNSTFYLAKITEDIEMLVKFIDDNPNHEFVPVAHYQIGYNSFVNTYYHKALTSFIQAKNTGNAIGKEAYGSVKERIFYLIAESNFLLDNISDALDAYELYISVFTDGEFVDEAYFKLGLINFNNNKHDISLNYFNRIIKDHYNSDKIGMSNYYIGEIYFESDQNTKALKYYQDALSGICDVGFTWERISHIYYKLKKYERAKESLEMIPADTKYLFDRFLLKGNIEFAQRHYDKALEAFNFAADHAEGSLQNEVVLSKKAWTLYQLKKYDEASLLYSRLSGTTTSPEKYIIKAATSAFSAENYLSAIEYFKQYTQNFQSGPDYHSAILGAADSYYNLGDFNNAIENYMLLIQPGIDEQILSNSINGLRWASEQSETISFTEKVDEILLRCSDKEIRVELLDRKIYYLYKNEKWQEAVNSSKELEILESDHKNASEIKLIRALCYEELGDYQNSINTYKELYSKKHDPDVLRHWARLLVKMNEYPPAIDKLRKASMLTRREDIWLELLEIELEQNSEYFENDFNKFLEFATGEEREIAELLEIEWKLQIDQIEGLELLINDLNKSKFNSVRARSQLLKGLLLSKSNNYEAAIPELLRIRYLYPEFEKIRNRAEFLACNFYIRSNKVDEAKKLFDVIKSDLPEKLKEDLVDLLNGGDE